jgi:CubicO group peptidase (beta-lactamase class C family)
MRTILVIVLLFLASPVIAQNNIIKKLDAYMQGQHDVNLFSGTVMVTRDNSVLMLKAYGLADQEWNVKNTIDTKYGLASITKQVTAISVLQLADAGKLSVEDKLVKYFPDFPNGDNITIHMLLTHTSGLALDFEELYLESTSLSKDSAIAYIKKLPLQFTPGTKLAYSNVGYFMLSQIVQKASGITFGDYLQKYIFDPAGMKNSGLCSNEKIIHKLARSYFKVDGKLVKNPYINWNLNVGLDGIYATVEDLYTLNKALSTTILLSNNSKAKMFTQYNKAFPDGNFLDSYGYGVFINPYFNHGHDMLTHSGGYFGVRTTFDIYPKDNVFITVLSNNESESHWIGYGLAGIIFGKEVEMPYVHIKAIIDPMLLIGYTGKYGNMEIIAENGKLYLNSKDVQLIPESPTKFFRADNPDRKFEFMLRKNSKAEGVIITKGGVKERIMREK